MKIDNRVEALELELKILKNEIQNTLLEIREQVLNHYYPELRAEEPSQTRQHVEQPASRISQGNNGNNGNSRIQTRTASLAPAAKAESVSPFSDVLLWDMEDEPDDDDLEDHYEAYDPAADDEMDDEIDTVHQSAAPRTREVVLKQLKPTEAKPTTRTKNSQENAVDKGHEPPRPAFAILAAWVGESVAKVGKERTIQVVETYAASGGALSKETKSSLLQLTSLANDVEPANPVGNQEMLDLMVGLDKILAV